MKRTCLAALLLVLAAPARAAEWVRVETQNFIVYGDTGERRLREVASEFERFREALARVIAGAGTPAAVPTVVVVFASQRTFEPFRPRFNGKPIKLGGYFFSSEDMNIVALADGAREESLRTIFHEYVHLVTANVAHGMPVWLNEGLAEYYSTFQVEDGGRRAIIGGIIPSHLYLLNRRRPMPIAELLAVDQQAADYNEGERRSLFYAQSWALVHMLVSGTNNRSALLGKYANLASSGTASLDAWKQVFGEEPVIRRLEQYVGQDVMKGLLYTFDRDIPRVTGDSSRVSAADAEATLGDLLRRVAPPEEATARFERAFALEPPSARARALYGLHALDQDEQEKARRLLLEASADKTDWLVQYHVATGLTELVDGRREPDRELLSAARDALDRVQSARPELPNALALRARLEAVDTKTLPQALTAIRRARSLAPGREDYMLLESYILLRRGEYVAARSLLDVLLTPAYSASVNSNARSLIEQIERAERSVAEYLAQLEGRKMPNGASSDAARREAASSRGAVSVPVYRKTGAGEARLEGRLERISCTTDGIEFQVRVDSGIERFSATTLDGIEFISYREDLSGAISCGPRKPPDHVYVTWRTGTIRQILAVEFLPR
jgi:Protein of unknown function (DUF1570)